MNRLISKVEFNFATIFYIERNNKYPYKNIINESNLVLFESVKYGSNVKEIYIKPPYLNSNFRLKFINSKYFRYAEIFGEKYSLGLDRRTSFLLRDGEKIIIQTANGSNYHNTHECIRKKLNIPTGTRYDLCEGCSPKNHAESKACVILSEQGYKFNIKRHKTYLWGHWWACEYCTDNLLNIGIDQMYMSKTWTRNFLKIKNL